MILTAALIAAIAGIFIGGLLNVLADDLPHYNTPKRPHYPDGTPRPLSAWLGITAFLLSQRCPPGEQPTRENCLTWRYPLTEIATAVMFFITVLRVDALANGAALEPQTFNVTQTLFWLYYMAMFVLIFVIDVEHRLILFAVIVPSAVVACVDMLLTPAAGTSVQWWMAPADPNLRRGLLGALTGFGTFFAFYLGGFVYQRVSAVLRGWAPDEIPFGYGDVMLITLSGLILGWRALILAMFITVFLGAAGALFFIALHKIRSGRSSMLIALPYGPYIIIGVVFMMLFPDVIQDFLFGIVYG